MADRTHTITLALTVSDADGDGVWVVTDDLGTVYGDAETPYDAVADYFSGIGSYLEVLQVGALGPALQQEYDKFKAWTEGQER